MGQPVEDEDRKFSVSVALNARIIARIKEHCENRSLFILEAIEERLAKLENDDHG